MHVELRQIHKRYGPVAANRGVSLDVRAGTIHGVLGENGAGKSTLMKILAGYTAKTSGEIIIEGRSVEYRSPLDATRRGIGMLYQDPLDFPGLSGVENFMLGNPNVGTRLAPEIHIDTLQRHAERLGFTLHPHRLLSGLTVGERQQLELLRLLAQGVRLLILDEPTTGITVEQKGALFAALRALADEGRSVLLVSHKLEDVEALCDRTTVLRQGEVVGEASSPYPSQQLLKLMFGTPPSSPPRVRRPAGEPVLQLQAVSAAGDRAGLQDCTVKIRQGEVVGLAGVEGSGQGVFLRVSAGVRSPRNGTLTYRGETVPRRGRWAGVVFLPAGRLEEGLLPGLSVQEHFTINQAKIPFLLARRADRERACAGIERMRVRGEPESPVESLSGGNQQRLLLSLIPPQPDLLLLENPTRGLDLESSQWVWTQLQDYRRRGATIVFSSAELDEIVDIADRVLVFYEGKLVLDRTMQDCSTEQLTAAIAGRVVGEEGRS